MISVVVLGFLRVRNRNAVPFAVAPNQNFDHVCDGSMRLARRNVKYLFQAGVYTKCERGSLDSDHSLFRNNWKCTALYSVHQYSRNVDCVDHQQTALFREAATAVADDLSFMFGF
jgi:hypothetical protein